jgi:hypothetical protein
MHKHVRNIMSCGINLERQFYLVLDIKKIFADLVSSWYLSSRSKLSTYNTTHDKMFNFKTVLYMNQFNCWPMWLMVFIIRTILIAFYNNL